MKKLILVLLLMLVLAGCVQPTATPEPTATREPIVYLIIKEGERAPVYTSPGSEIYLDPGTYMRSGDAVPVRETKNWEGYMWYEVLVGHLAQFETGSVGWVKFKADKMYLEVR